MKDYCVYWFENGEPRHEVFSCLDGAEMFSCMIRGQDGVEHVEISEEDISAPEEFRRSLAVKGPYLVVKSGSVNHFFTD